jgi:glycerophosphoryl diester phosphodiesterase
LEADGAPVLKAPAPRLIAGHRGATRGVDENTISAMAYALPYADVLETDVRLTSDKKMVIMHDATLNRTTNCTGNVSDRSLAAIKKCTTPRGHHPPSLRQLLQWANGQAKTPELQLELKGTWTQAQVQGFVNEATSYDLEAAASSFSTATLAKVERANDSLPDETAGRHLDTVLIEGGDPTMPPFLVCDSYAGYANSISYLKKTYVDALQQVCNPPTYAAVYGSIDSDAEYQKAYDTTADMWIVEDAKDARRWLANR